MFKFKGGNDYLLFNYPLISPLFGKQSGSKIIT